MNRPTVGARRAADWILRDLPARLRVWDTQDRELDDARASTPYQERDSAQETEEQTRIRHIRRAEVATVIDRESGLPEAVAALKAVLLFHGGGEWDAVKRSAWELLLTQCFESTAVRLPPTNEATTKNLCDAVRAALAKIENP